MDNGVLQSYDGGGNGAYLIIGNDGENGGQVVTLSGANNITGGAIIFDGTSSTLTFDGGIINATTHVHLAGAGNVFNIISGNVTLNDSPLVSPYGDTPPDQVDPEVQMGLSGTGILTLDNFVCGTTSGAFCQTGGTLNLTHASSLATQQSISTSGSGSASTTVNIGAATGNDTSSLTIGAGSTVNTAAAGDQLLINVGTATTTGNSLNVTAGNLDASTQVVLNGGNNLNVSGGTVALNGSGPANEQDTWAGTIHLADGTLILDSTVQIGTLNQTGGNLVLQGGFLLKLEAGSVMSGGTLAFSGGGNTLELAGVTCGAALDLTMSNTLWLSSGAAATFSNTVTNWAGGSVKLKGGTLTSNGFAHNSADGSYIQTSGVLDLTRNADKTPSALTLTTVDSTITGGKVNIGGISGASDRGNSLTISTNGTFDGVIGLDYAASVTIAVGNTLNVTGGIVNLNGSGAGTDYWSGTVNVSATAGRGGYLTLSGMNNNTGTIFTQDNGTIFLTSQSTLHLASGCSITGGNVILDATYHQNKVYVASGGTFASNAAINIATGNSFYVTGGTATLNGSGAGSDNWDGAVSFSAGTLTLDSIVQNGTLSQTGGTSTVSGVVTIGTMSGGTANLNGTTSAIATLNGGTLNLGNTALTVSGGTTSGAITGAGGSLIKAGSGTLSLTGTNTYGGATTVTAGTLSVSNPNFCPTAPLSIASGAVLSLPGGGIHKVSALVLGGATQPEGLYQAANTGGAITGGGVIQVGDAVVTPAYLTWAASLPGFTDTYPTHDSDGDGMTNQQEYAFGLDPRSGASVNPIRVPLDQADGTFSYSRLDPTTTGLAYTVETSPDLSIWTEDAAATQTVTQTVVGVQAVEVTLSCPIPLAALQLFVRVATQ